VEGHTVGPLQSALHGTNYIKGTKWFCAMGAGGGGGVKDAAAQSAYSNM